MQIGIINELTYQRHIKIIWEIGCLSRYILGTHVRASYICYALLSIGTLSTTWLMLRTCHNQMKFASNWPCLLVPCQCCCLANNIYLAEKNINSYKT